MSSCGRCLIREGLRSRGGVLADVFCWLSRAVFCEGMGRSVTDETVWEIDGGPSWSIFKERVRFLEDGEAEVE